MYKQYFAIITVWFFIPVTSHRGGEGRLMFYPCQYVSYLILLNDANTTLTNPLKLAHKVMDHKRKATLDSAAYHYFFVFWVMPLFSLATRCGHPCPMDIFCHIWLSFQIVRISPTSVNPDIKALFVCNCFDTSEMTSNYSEQYSKCMNIDMSTRLGTKWHASTSQYKASITKLKQMLL